MIKAGQSATIRRYDEVYKGKVVSVTNDGKNGSILFEGEDYEVNFHENDLNRKHYTAMGNFVELR